MAIRTIVTLPYTLVALPYNYVYGAQKSEVSNIEDNWENIQTDKEQAEEQRKKICAVTDPIFTAKIEEQKVYSYDVLKRCGRKDPEDRLLVPFKQFGPENPYLRRSNLVPSIYNVSDYYHVDMAERIIQQYLPNSNRDRTPMDYLHKQLEQKDPRALQVAAVLFQLGDDSSCLPPLPENLENLMALQDQIVITPIEQGDVYLDKKQGNDLQFIIKGDVNRVTDKNGELIRTYETTRTVTVSCPAPDQSVSCEIITISN